MADDNFKLIWTPEGASKQEWSFNIQNPVWDIRIQTEKATGWPWARFAENLMDGSAIAMQALLWVLRKRTERGLTLESVIPDYDELEPQFRCADCDRWLSDEDADEDGEHGCTGKAEADSDEPTEAKPGEA
jgi:hypothetical protein